MALKDWMHSFRTDVPSYAPPKLPIVSPLIPVIFSQIAKYKIPERFPTIDAWAVPIHKVMSLQAKFRSSDLKDYLGIPKSRKLILSTAAPDNFMEVLWEKRFELNFSQFGIDYWFPAHFSIYDADGKAYQLFNAKRQQIHAVTVRSQFVWFRLGEYVPVDFLEPIRGARAVLISCQQMYSALNRSILCREVQIADQWFSPEAQFFFIGRARGGVGPLRSNRKVFRFDERWIMLGLHGRDRQNHPVPRLGIRALLIKNLREALCEYGRIQH